MFKVVLSLIVLMASMTVALPVNAAFSDVSTDNYYYDAITDLQNKGIVNGFQDGTYKPENEIARDEFLKIVLGATYSQEDIQNCTTQAFPDVSGYWATNYVCFAKQINLINGDNGMFYPKRNITLAEASKIIAKAFGSNETTIEGDWWIPYLQFLEDKKALPWTLKGIQKNINRGDMAEMVYRLGNTITDKPSLEIGEIDIQDEFIIQKINLKIKGNQLETRKFRDECKQSNISKIFDCTRIYELDSLLIENKNLKPVSRGNVDNTIILIESEENEIKVEDISDYFNNVGGGFLRFKVTISFNPNANEDDCLSDVVQYNFASNFEDVEEYITTKVVNQGDFCYYFSQINNEYLYAKSTKLSGNINLLIEEIEMLSENE